MFNGGQSGVLFGGTATQSNTFGQNQTNAMNFFGTSNVVNGTTYPYQPADSTDTVQKNNSNVNISTKLHCLTAMPVYEKKSIEELRSEDYQANRLIKATNAMFGGQMNSQPTMFTSTYQPSQSTLFSGITQQTNTFGNKSLFGATNTSPNTSFGTFNNQSKPNSLFLANTVSTANKPLFGNVQPTQSASIFGSSTSTGTSNLFGATPTQTFFGTTQQPSQSTSLFGTATNTGSFGFQAPASTSLFGAAAKPFGATSTASVFGNIPATSSGSLFGQQTTSTAFGGGAKTPMFTGAFSGASQSTSLFGQTSAVVTSSLFGNQPKPATATFGTPSLFTNNTATATKPSLFGTGLFGNTGTTPAFGTQPLATNPGIGSTPTLGFTNAAEALQQQQAIQQKILSVVTKWPYGVNQMFMGHSPVADRTTTSPNTTANNILSLAIKKTDTDSSRSVQRRKVLFQPTKVVPKNLHKIFSGFDDDDDDLSTKSNKFDRQFLIKREDWKYLPPNAFNKSQNSINCNITKNGDVNLFSEVTKNSNISKNSRTRKNDDFIGISDVTKNSIIDKNDDLTNELTKTTKESRKGDFAVNSDVIKNSNNLLVTPLINAERKLHSTPILDTSPGAWTLNDSLSPIGNYTAGEEKLGKSSFEETHDLSDSKLEAETGNLCGITLTKEDYYTAPTMDVLDKLVTTNDDNEHECWVENFIIGRRSFGSIRFPGLTNVYGLNFDELVDIRRKEVIVYPDENTRPEEGEEINKLAQIILQGVWPMDKCTNQPITGGDRLNTMGFEDRLRRVTERMGARYINYEPTKGVWIFEVDHFSKYGYIESEEEEEVPVVNKPIVESTNPTVIVSAEADSQTHFPEEVRGSIAGRLVPGLFNVANNRSFQRMKQNLYRDNIEEDDYHSDGFFGASKMSFGAGITQKEEPLAKRFETHEMGRSLLNSSLNNSLMDYENQAIFKRASNVAAHENSSRPLKALVVEQIASTEQIVRVRGSTQLLKMPNFFRDIRSMKMPYLPLKLSQQLESRLSDIHKLCSLDYAMSQGNRFRVGLHMSSNSCSVGLKFVRKDYSNFPDINLSPNRIIKQVNPIQSALNIMKLEYQLSDYQQQLLESALKCSRFSYDDNDDCPLWRPLDNLQVLDGYASVHPISTDSSNLEVAVFERIVALCTALWADIKDRDSKSPTNMMALERRQSLSKWIRMASRNELIRKVTAVMKTTTRLDIGKCNDMILESLCCGEIKLACSMATKTGQHRMALLISQCAGSKTGRDMICDQINCWILDKTDRHIPDNIMCIYVLLSGQISIVTSDGTIISPLKQLKWYQAFGCYQWYIQPYLESIKSSIDLYTEDFKTCANIPDPFPFNSPDTSDYPFYDCCYHLLRLYCDSLYDLDCVVNPPTMSANNIHKLCLDWSSSWHLSNILISLGRSIASNDRICIEWAAQLERAGQWHWAAFIVLHLDHFKERKNLLRNLIIRNSTGTKIWTDKETFLVENLQVPKKWIYEGKAIYCRNINDRAMEAYNWLKFGDYEKSHWIYSEEILPQLLIDDKLDEMSEILDQFVALSVDRYLTSWPLNGGLYLQYVAVMRNMRTLNITNRIVRHTILSGETALPSEIFGDEDNGVDNNLQAQINKLKIQIMDMSMVVVNYAETSAVKRICKREMEAVCTKVLKSCSNTDVY